MDKYEVGLLLFILIYLSLIGGVLAANSKGSARAVLIDPYSLEDWELEDLCRTNPQVQRCIEIKERKDRFEVLLKDDKVYNVPVETDRGQVIIELDNTTDVILE